MERPEKLMKIPYRTCRLLILLGPFLQNGTEKYQKALGVSVKVECVLRSGKTSKKPLVKQCFGASGKVDGNTL